MKHEEDGEQLCKVMVNRRNVAQMLNTLKARGNQEMSSNLIGSDEI